MELQIQDLITSIQKDGIDAAQAEAAKILDAAREQAAGLVAEAKEQAAQLVTQAKEEAALLQESARVEAQHARRDALLSFRQAVQQEVSRLLAGQTRESLQDEALAKVIAAALQGEDPSLYTAEVQQVTRGLQNALADELQKGLTLSLSPAVHCGFRLTAKDGSGYLDCSDEELMALLAPFFPQEL